ANEPGFEEDVRTRDLHPNDQIEFRRLGNFETKRDLDHSDRFIHLYDGYHAQTKDHRLFGHVIIPEALVERDVGGALTGIPLVESGVLRAIEAMGQSLNSRGEKDRPSWNRLFINITPTMEVNDGEAAGFALHLAEKYNDQFRALKLEKVVVR